MKYSSYEKGEDIETEKMEGLRKKKLDYHIPHVLVDYLIKAC